MPHDGFDLGPYEWDRLPAPSRVKLATRLVATRKLSLILEILTRAEHFQELQEATRQCDDPELVQHLIELLGDSSESIRSRAAGALGPLGGEEAARVLGARLSQVDLSEYSVEWDDEAHNIIGALSRLASAAARDALLGTLADRTVDIHHRIDIAAAAVRCGSPKGMAFLVRGLERAVGHTEFAHALLEFGAERP